MDNCQYREWGWHDGGPLYVCSSKANLGYCCKDDYNDYYSGKDCSYNLIHPSKMEIENESFPRIEVFVDDKIIVTLSIAVPIGVHVYQQQYRSKVFSCKKSINDILAWAKEEGFENPKISDLQFSEYTGESL